MAAQLMHVLLHLINIVYSSRFTLDTHEHYNHNDNLYFWHGTRLASGRNLFTVTLRHYIIVMFMVYCYGFG